MVGIRRHQKRARKKSHQKHSPVGVEWGKAKEDIGDWQVYSEAEYEQIPPFHWWKTEQKWKNGLTNENSNKLHTFAYSPTPYIQHSPGSLSNIRTKRGFFSILLYLFLGHLLLSRSEQPPFQKAQKQTN